MNTHIKLVGVLHLVLGAMGLLGALIVLAVFETAGGFAAWQGGHAPAVFIGIIGLCIGGLVALLAAPELIGGWALLTGKSWARIFMIALGILELLHFPFGTALGVYTLWVMFALENRGQPAAYSGSQPVTQ